jgi:hypothetical protein
MFCADNTYFMIDDVLCPHAKPLAVSPPPFPGPWNPAPKRNSKTTKQQYFHRPFYEDSFLARIAFGRPDAMKTTNH